MPDVLNKFGKAEYRARMTPSQIESAEFITPHMNQAIKQAEGNPRNYGVVSEQVNNPQEANTILNNSIFNNFYRWISAGQPGKFVDFMRNRWAPLNAPNDPNNLNYNWAPNVRGGLLDILGPEEYDRWRRYNMVMKPMEYFGRT